MTSSTQTVGIVLDAPTNNDGSIRIVSPRPVMFTFTGRGKAEKIHATTFTQDPDNGQITLEGTVTRDVSKDDASVIATGPAPIKWTAKTDVFEALTIHSIENLPNLAGPNTFQEDITLADGKCLNLGIDGNVKICRVGDDLVIRDVTSGTDITLSTLANGGAASIPLATETVQGRGEAATLEELTRTTPELHKYVPANKVIGVPVNNVDLTQSAGYVVKLGADGKIDPAFLPDSTGTGTGTGTGTAPNIGNIQLEKTVNVNTLFGKFTISDDGNTIYAGTSFQGLGSFPLPGSYDLGSAALVLQSGFTGTAARMFTSSHRFNGDGTKIISINDNDAQTHDLSTPYDLSTVSNSRNVVDLTGVAGIGGNFFSGDISRDGKYYYMHFSNQIHQFELTTPFDTAGGVTYNGMVAVTGLPATMQNIRITGDGKYIIGHNFGAFNLLELTTAFDITTLTYDPATDNFTLPGNQAADYIEINADASVLMVGDFMNSGLTSLYQYSLT
jgi:hypothetical protein